MKISITLVTLTAVVAGQVRNDKLPECSIGCLAESGAKFGCGIDDAICQCSNAKLIAEYISSCLSNDCNAYDQETFRSTAINNCKEWGISLHDIPELKKRDHGHLPMRCENGEWPPCETGT